MSKLETETTIPAPAEKVWKVLTDFASYSQWNPLILKAQGAAEMGANIALRIRPDESRPPYGFTGKIVVCEPNERLEWTGGLPGYRAERHYFQLISEGGATRLLHGETFSGIYSWLFFGEKDVARLRPAYERMNQALVQWIKAK